MTDPRATTCHYSRRLSSGRSAQVHHHHHCTSVADAHFAPPSPVEHPLNSDRHTLFFILNSASSASDCESASTPLGADECGIRSPLAHEELSYHIVIPPAARPAWVSSDSSSASGDTSPSMMVSSMIHDLRMSSPTTCSAVSTRYASGCDAASPMAVSAISAIVQDLRKSSPGTTRRAPAASSTASKAEQLSKLEKKRDRMCKMAGCENYIVHKGLCCRHGVSCGGKKCSIAGCNTSAKYLGLCWKHGGSTECDIDGCTKRAKARRLCWAHGGGTKCSSGSCPKVAVSNGCCWAHGGGKRCAFEGCEKAAYRRTHNYCVAHHELLKDGNVTLEV